MPGVVAALGPGLVLKLVGTVIKPILPWLKEQAARSETPLDDWAVEFLEEIFGVKGE